MISKHRRPALLESHQIEGCFGVSDVDESYVMRLSVLHNQLLVLVQVAIDDGIVLMDELDTSYPCNYKSIL